MNIRIGIFKNTRTGVYAKITRNPNEQFLKYKTCYGYIGYGEGEFFKKSREIYDFEKNEWILEWSI